MNNLLSDHERFKCLFLASLIVLCFVLFIIHRKIKAFSAMDEENDKRERLGYSRKAEWNYNVKPKKWKR